MTSSRKQQAAETEAALKAAARRVFARNGYLNTKITDITSEAGRAAGSFYNHFDSKEELLKALLADALAVTDERVEAADSGHSPDFSDREAVRWHIAASWRFFKENRVELTALRQAALVNEEFGAQVERMMTEDSGHLAEHLSRVTEAGRTLPGDPGLVLTMITTLLHGFAARWRDDSFPDDEVIDALTTFVYRAVNGTD